MNRSGENVVSYPMGLNLPSSSGCPCSMPNAEQFCHSRPVSGRILPDPPEKILKSCFGMPDLLSYWGPNSSCFIHVQSYDSHATLNDSPTEFC